MSCLSVGLDAEPSTIPCYICVVILYESIEGSNAGHHTPRKSQLSELVELLARGLNVMFSILCPSYLSKVKVAANYPAFWEVGVTEL